MRSTNCCERSSLLEMIVVVVMTIRLIFLSSLSVVSWIEGFWAAKVCFLLFYAFTMRLLAFFDLYCIIDIHFRVLSFQIEDLVASWWEIFESSVTLEALSFSDLRSSSRWLGRHSSKLSMQTKPYSNVTTAHFAISAISGSRKSQLPSSFFAFWNAFSLALELFL